MHLGWTFRSQTPVSNQPYGQKCWGANCSEFFYLQVMLQTVQNIHLLPEHHHPSASLTLIKSCMKEDDHAGGHCRPTEPRQCALPPEWKDIYFSSVHSGSYEDAEEPVSQPVVQFCRFTLTGHQLLTSPHSKSFLCMISNELARYSNCRIPKYLFPLIPRLQPPFNSCTSSFFDPAGSQPNHLQFIPWPVKHRFGMFNLCLILHMFWSVQCFFMLSDSLLSIVLSFPIKLSQCISLKYLIIRGIILHFLPLLPRVDWLNQHDGSWVVFRTQCDHIWFVHKGFSFLWMPGGCNLMFTY